jgi:GT2 family glycosyltransferase
MNRRSDVMKLIALSTAHNRCARTLASLGDLAGQHLPAGTTLDIVLVDDGSTDRTGECVAQRFPDVRIVPGTGQLYWAGGMRFGWDLAVRDRDFDALLVFNDDVRLRPDAVSVLLDAHRELVARGVESHVVAGPFQDPDTGRFTYGGLIRRVTWFPSFHFTTTVPAGDMVRCDTLHMNCALITRGALDRIGFLDPVYTHAAADIDFGLRLTRAGGQVWQAPSFIGTCARNGLEGTASEPGIGPVRRLRRVLGPKESPPWERAVHCRRHAGHMWPFVWLWGYIRPFTRAAR